MFTKNYSLFKIIDCKERLHIDTTFTLSVKISRCKKKSVKNLVGKKN